MIDPTTGALLFKDGLRLDPGADLGKFLETRPTAQPVPGAPGLERYRFDDLLQDGDRSTLIILFANNRLTGWGIRLPDAPSTEEDWLKGSPLLRRWYEERLSMWLGPGRSFPWGTVQLNGDPGGETFIQVAYRDPGPRS